MLRGGRPIQAVFQQATRTGAAVRVAFDGEVPLVPEAGSAGPADRAQAHTEDGSGFWPDYIPPDD